MTSESLIEDLSATNPARAASCGRIRKMLKSAHKAAPNEEVNAIARKMAEKVDLQMRGVDADDDESWRALKGTAKEDFERELIDDLCARSARAQVEDWERKGRSE